MQTYPEEVPPIIAWEVEAPLRKMKNWKEAGNLDQVNIESLKAGDETIAKQLAKLYTQSAWKNDASLNMEGSKYGDIFHER